MLGGGGNWLSCDVVIWVPNQVMSETSGLWTAQSFQIRFESQLFLWSSLGQVIHHLSVSIWDDSCFSLQHSLLHSWICLSSGLCDVLNDCSGNKLFLLMFLTSYKPDINVLSLDFLSLCLSLHTCLCLDLSNCQLLLLVFKN